MVERDTTGPNWVDAMDDSPDRRARQCSIREDALIVVAADKLHNATATLADFASPDGLDWSRFNVGPEETLWFYDAMLNVLIRRIGA